MQRGKRGGFHRADVARCQHRSLHIHLHNTLKIFNHPFLEIFVQGLRIIYACLSIDRLVPFFFFRFSWNCSSCYRMRNFIQIPQLLMTAKLQFLCLFCPSSHLASSSKMYISFYRLRSLIFVNNHHVRPDSPRKSGRNSRCSRASRLTVAFMCCKWIQSNITKHDNLIIFFFFLRLANLFEHGPEPARWMF